MNSEYAHGIKNNILTQSFVCRLTACLIILFIAYGCAGNKPGIISAAGSGDMNTVKRLQAEGQSINEADSSGVTPLMYAISSKNKDVAKYLIESGADIKAKDKKGCDALIYAVDIGQVEIVNTLLDRGANIESKDQTNSTPLSHAIYFGHDDITKLLIERGANIESKDWTGATPIINAIKLSANEKIIHLLIKRGANLNVKDKEGYTPLSWALFYKKMDLAAEIKKAMANVRKDLPSAKIVFIRDSNVLIPGEMQDVEIYINEELMVNLRRNSTDYIDINSGKCTMVIKGTRILQGDHVKSFDAVAGQTYYFLVTRRIGSMVAGFAGAIGQVAESKSKGEKAGPFEITPLEESMAKEKIKLMLKPTK
jgi:hypothetical protein